MAGTNLRTRDGFPFNFIDGLKVNYREIHGVKYRFAGNGSNLILHYQLRRTIKILLIYLLSNYMFILPTILWLGMLLLF